jgi:hypothetical protein
MRKPLPCNLFSERETTFEPVWMQSQPGDSIAAGKPMKVQISGKKFQESVIFLFLKNF